MSDTGAEVAVALEGVFEMDLSNASALTPVLARIVETQPATVTIDLANLSFLDSSGIRCLCNAAEDASATGCVLRVQHATPAVLRVLEICGVDEVLLNRSNSDALDDH